MSKTYDIWYNMKRRCNDPDHLTAERYREKGISYDPSWEDFTQFVRDMGTKPDGCTLDRIDNSKGYSKENCRWATPFEQAHNKRLYKNNTSGIKGVSWQTPRGKWRAYGKLTPESPLESLYYGYDFFEACCARKSWENKHGVGT